MSRTLLALAAACVAMIGAPAAMAAPAAEQVQIHGARGMSSDDYAAVRGQYDLSNGSRLSIEGTRQHPMAQIDDQQPVALVMTGPNQFSDAAGTMRVDIQAAPNGSISGLTMTYGQRVVRAAAAAGRG